MSSSTSTPTYGVPPPPQPRPKRWSPKYIALTIVGIFALVSGGLFLVRYLVVRSGITEIPDKQFGDQWLKTTVALVELHKVRYGKYPNSLSDLKFIGDWDRAALQSVRYFPNADRTAYYIEVETGWVGKPTLKMPAEFWRGTGYDPNLKPKN